MKIEKIYRGDMETHIAIRIANKLDEIIDVLNNSQQEEKIMGNVIDPKTGKELHAVLVNADQPSKEEKIRKRECKHEWEKFWHGAKIRWECNKCRTPKSDDQPSKPSIREQIDEISEWMLNDDQVDQILDLITKHLLEEVEEHSRLASRLGEVEYVKSITLDEIKELINNIKK